MKLELIVREPKSNPKPCPILFIHGMWHGAWCWDEHFLSYFADHGYRSYAMSLRGHGKSEKPKSLRWTCMADYVADVENVVAEIDALPVLVGHSMGGAVVQKYLESHKAAAGVLVASVPPSGVLPASFRFLLRHPIPFLKANATLSMYPIIATPHLTQDAFFSPSISQDQLNTYFTRLQDDSFRVYFSMLAPWFVKPSLVNTPIKVYGAENDKVFTPQEVRATAKAYGTEPEVFPNMAHDMMLEPGWQKVADRIMEWLNSKAL